MSANHVFLMNTLCHETKYGGMSPVIGHKNKFIHALDELFKPDDELVTLKENSPRFEAPSISFENGFISFKESHVSFERPKISVEDGLITWLL